MSDLPTFAFREPDDDAKKIRDMMAGAVLDAWRRRLYCEALIDQDRYIGGDPVGHGCSNAATMTHWKGGLGWRLCARCAALLEAEPRRVTLPWWKGEPGHE